MKTKSIFLLLCCVLYAAGLAMAAGSEWQKMAKGPQVRQQERPKRHYAQTTQTYYSAAGLAMELRLDKKPALLKRSLIFSPQGLQHQHDMTANFHLFELGDIGLGLDLPEKPRVTGDWTHTTFTYESPDKKTGAGDAIYLKIYVTRLSPALVAETNHNELLLFDGKQQFSAIESRRDPAWQIKWQVDDPVKFEPIVPAYCAAPLDDDSAAISIPPALEPMDTNDGPRAAGAKALLFWWGQRSHMKSSKHPLAHYGETEAFFETYKPVDCPLLVVFENPPASMTKAQTGGVELHFDSAAGKIAILPLYGGAYPSVNETAAWQKSLPAEVRRRCRQWTGYLAHIPMRATEDYSQESGNVTITEAFDYLDIDSDAPYCAPLPPVLGAAKLEGFDAGFSSAPKDLHYDLSIGTYMVVEGAKSYSWTVEGLDKYVDFQPSPKPAIADPKLKTILADEIDKLTAAGLLSPWYLESNGHWLGGDIPEGVERVFFESPGERLFLLTQIMKLLPETQNPRLAEYIKTLRQTWPPEKCASTDPDKGARRERYLREQPALQRWLADRYKGRPVGGARDWYLINRLLPMEGLYGLADFYQMNGAPLPPGEWNDVKDILKPWLRNMDWASMFFFQWEGMGRSAAYEGRNGVDRMNTLFAAALGLTRLAKMADDKDAESTGWGLLAKSCALRYAAGKYVSFLYRRGHIQVPDNPDWMMTDWTTWGGHLYIPNFTDGSKDIRQIAEMNEYGVTILDRSNYLRPCFLLPFMDITPELALFLRENLMPECDQYIKIVEFNCPEWYICRGEQYLGGEWNHVLPWDPYQLYMAKLWIQHVPAPQMAEYLDISWLQRGDLYYIHKLAATAAANFSPSTE